MLKTKALLKQLNKIDSNKAVFITAMTGGLIINQYGLFEAASARMINKSNNTMVKSLLLTALSSPGEEVATCFDTKMLRSSVKKCIRSNHDQIHIYIDELNSSAQLMSVIVSESSFFLVVDWGELANTNSECI